MPHTPPCYLTTKDFCILEAMLERNACGEQAFVRLLRHKLSTATIVFQGDVDPRVVTVNSRIVYSVDGASVDSRIIAHGSEGDFPDLKVLPISTLRGLALLGHMAGDTILIEQSDGTSEEIRIDDVVQPRLERRGGLHPILAEKSAPESALQPSVVVALPARQKASKVNIGASTDPYDDDPGPRAA